MPFELRGFSLSTVVLGAGALGGYVHQTMYRRRWSQHCLICCGTRVATAPNTLSFFFFFFFFPGEGPEGAQAVWVSRAAAPPVSGSESRCRETQVF